MKFLILLVVVVVVVVVVSRLRKQFSGEIERARQIRRSKRDGL